MSKPLPQLTSDAAAERFVDEADLTQFDLAAFKPPNFEFAPKSKQVNMRFPAALLDAVDDVSAVYPAGAGGGGAVRVGAVNR